MIKLIIAGGREFKDYNKLKAVVDKVFYYREDMELAEIISGGARGADSLGERYARERGIPIKKFSAEWSTHGRRAGILRNNKMAEHGTHLIAFWDGKSTGTRHMISAAKANGLQVNIIHY